MKATIVFFVVLIFASFALRDFNAQEGHTKLAVVINTTFMLSVIYIVSMISVKDIQKMMKNQIKKDTLEGIISFSSPKHQKNNKIP